MNKVKEIIPISKKDFDVLSKAEQRIAIAKDVLHRIELKQLVPIAGNFCDIGRLATSNMDVSQILKNPTISCEVCAKGGLFMSYIGVVNSYKVGDVRPTTGASNDSAEMNLLSKIFSKEQLSLIETAFEGKFLRWNAPLSEIQQEACYRFYREYSTSFTKRLNAICENIIKNDGIFIP